MVNNFAYGKVLVIDSGYYAQRAKMMSEVALQAYGQIKEINRVDWQSYDEVGGQYDWVIACYTETSIGLKLDIEKIRAKADTLGAKLMLDATASIGLEPNHDLADAISYSSCKGLFGFTKKSSGPFPGAVNLRSPVLAQAVKDTIKTEITKGRKRRIWLLPNSINDNSKIDLR